jgi:hypothetical protein
MNGELEECEKKHMETVLQMSSGFSVISYVVEKINRFEHHGRMVSTAASH